MISVAVFLVAIATVVGLSDNSVLDFPAVTNAEENAGNTAYDNLTQVSAFDEINRLGRDNKTNPTLEKAKNLAVVIFDNFSILEIPTGEKLQITEQVGTAHFNGSSDIQNINIVSTINSLASSSAAPDFAYTSLEQVDVTRKYLSRLVPDVVSTSGGMSDLEAFAVFVGLLSQKIDNEDFMVTPTQFTARVDSLSGSQVPGNPIEGGRVEVVQETAETYRMIEAINNFVGSKNRLATSDVILMIGIQ